MIAKKWSVHLCAALALVFLAPMASAATLVQWDFNSTVPDANTTTGNLSASIGTGTAALLNTTGGGTSAALFATGTTRDPAPAADNTALIATNFPAQGVGSGTAGMAFTGMNLSTITGDVSISFDLRVSNTGSRFYKILTSTDGSNFNFDAGNVSVSAGAVFQTVAVTVPQAQAQSPTFAFRLVSIFDPANNTSYTAAQGTYGATGTTRVDLVAIDTPPVPEPATLGLVSGLAILGLRRRRA
jgi:hypothetical protein